jgi:hypothetical protein
MKIAFALGFALFVALAVTALAQPITRDMSERRLVEIKGRPASVTRSDAKAVYSWPDVQVTFEHGKITTIQYRDDVKEQRPEKQSRTQEAKAKAEARAEDYSKAKNAKDQPLEAAGKTYLIQVLKTSPEGAVVAIVAYAQRKSAGAEGGDRGPREFLARTRDEEVFVENLTEYKEGATLEIRADSVDRRKRMGNRSYDSYRLISAARIPATKS